MTGAHNICISQWLWARTQLASLLDTRIKVLASREAREREAARAHEAEEELERSKTREKRAQLGFRRQSTWQAPEPQLLTLTLEPEKGEERRGSVMPI